jgi:ABC-2 type transport system permease protein
MSTLPPMWQWLGHYNPFFYMIDGFRYGFIGQSEGPLIFGAGLLIIINIALVILCHRMLSTGYKIKS